MNVICEIAAPFVANSAVDESPVIRPVRSHTESCIKCQARYAAMARTARDLTVLSGDEVAAPADLEWKVMSSLEGDLAVARSIKAPVALIAALLSMAAAIVIWRIRPRAQA